MQEELRDIIAEAKAKGLVPVVWSYPRGGKISKEGETALDIVAYAAHMAALMGATIIKVKPPKAGVDLAAAKEAYEKAEVPMDTLAERIAPRDAGDASPAGGWSCSRAARPRAPRACSTRSAQIRDGGGHGSIIGRNSFQRPKAQALELLDQVVKIYLGQA